MLEVFPKPIKNLPEADIHLNGIKAYLSQSRNHQVIFMEFSKDVEVPEHSHESQWGIVLEGKIELVIGGAKHTYLRGDRYFIPKGVKHSAKIYAGYADVTYFNEKARYKSRRTPTTEKLREISDHLHYEVWMLVSLAKGMASGILGQGPIANAVLESFIIHIRAVTNFLYAKEPQVDDAIAEDFFDTPEEWTKIRPALSKLLSQAKRRAGKEVAHLTYARLDVIPERKPWPFVQISDEISLVIKAFLENVPKNRLGSKWSPPIGRPNARLSPDQQKPRSS